MISLNPRTRLQSSPPSDNQPIASLLHPASARHRHHARYHHHTGPSPASLTQPIPCPNPRNTLALSHLTADPAPHHSRCQKIPPARRALSHKRSQPEASKTKPKRQLYPPTCTIFRLCRHPAASLHRHSQSCTDQPPHPRRNTATYTAIPICFKNALHRPAYRANVAATSARIASLWRTVPIASCIRYSVSGSPI